MAPSILNLLAYSFERFERFEPHTNRSGVISWVESLFLFLFFRDGTVGTRECYWKPCISSSSPSPSSSPCYSGYSCYESYQDYQDLNNITGPRSALTIPAITRSAYATSYLAKSGRGEIAFGLLEALLGDTLSTTLQGDRIMTDLLCSGNGENENEEDK
ncbi:hypothetical protein BDP27DRAFT_1418704 [Rhodocollybia butyracea]|uniref:Uncharacterized protein n=1 Tax=Rhodocollybia butyracea TaxID=206335 RepID=A0A9P5PZ54_9AGAR|nr:hypothetical protein BDP27DRAFT_1418704 [Rhodocollybia butyracea]